MTYSYTAYKKYTIHQTDWDAKYLIDTVPIANATDKRKLFV